MPCFPINLKLEDRKCLVVGGGTVAERKVVTLLSFRAKVAIASPELTPALRDLANEGSVQVADTYSPDLLDDVFLTFAATNDRDFNRVVSEQCRRRGIPVNVVDDPELCTFLMPSVLQRGEFVISVSTSGRSPALAKWVRERLEASFGPEFGELADLLGALRDEVKARYSDTADRNQAYRRILDSEVLDLLAEGKREEAVRRARECI